MRDRIGRETNHGHVEQKQSIGLWSSLGLDQYLVPVLFQDEVYQQMDVVPWNNPLATAQCINTALSNLITNQSLG